MRIKFMKFCSEKFFPGRYTLLLLLLLWLTLLISRTGYLQPGALMYFFLSVALLYLVWWFDYVLSPLDNSNLISINVDPKSSHLETRSRIPKFRSIMIATGGHYSSLSSTKWFVTREPLTPLRRFKGQISHRVQFQNCLNCWKPTLIEDEISHCLGLVGSLMTCLPASFWHNAFRTEVEVLGSAAHELAHS